MERLFKNFRFCS